MPQYILLLREDPTQFEDISPAMIEAIIERYKSWRESVEAKGNAISGEKLQDGTGRVLRPGGMPATDGPYAETKEIAAGFFMITAADYAEAEQIAATCPHLDFGSIEIREIQPTD